MNNPEKPWGVFIYYPNTVKPCLFGQYHDRGLAENQARFFRRAIPTAQFAIAFLANYTKAPAA